MQESSSAIKAANISALIYVPNYGTSIVLLLRRTLQPHNRGKGISFAAMQDWESRNGLF